MNGNNNTSVVYMGEAGFLGHSLLIKLDLWRLYRVTNAIKWWILNAPAIQQFPCRYNNNLPSHNTQQSNTLWVKVDIICTYNTHTLGPVLEQVICKYIIHRLLLIRLNNYKTHFAKLQAMNILVFFINYKMNCNFSTHNILINVLLISL